jgi:adenine/guanine phosphoribosyltransferase-like PRPP-binding protein
MHRIFVEAAERPRVENVPEILGKLMPALSGLMKVLAPDVEAGRFDLIIGEDTSGRIPTRMLARALNTRLRAAGRRALPVACVQGIRNEQKEDPGLVRLRARVEEMRRAIPALPQQPRALIITEMVDTAGSLANLGRVLNEAGIGFDVASADIWAAPDKLRATLPAGTRLYGGGGQVYHLVCNRPSLSGLVREKYAAQPWLTDPDARAITNASRRESARLGSILSAAPDARPVFPAPRTATFIDL